MRIGFVTTHIEDTARDCAIRAHMGFVYPPIQPVVIFDDFRLVGGGRVLLIHRACCNTTMGKIRSYPSTADDAPLQLPPSKKSATMVCTRMDGTPSCSSNVRRAPIPVIRR